jgi:hypothetical protein
MGQAHVHAIKMRIAIQRWSNSLLSSDQYAEDAAARRPSERVGVEWSDPDLILH